MYFFLNQILPGIGDELRVLIAAMIPIIEVKGAIPIGIALGMNPLHAALMSYLGSVLPAPFIILGARKLLLRLSKIGLFKNTVERVVKRSSDQYSKQYQKYGAWALFIFVAIPIPGTGVWSGSLISSTINLRFKYGIIAILAGNLIATALILVLSYGVQALISF